MTYFVNHIFYIFIAAIIIAAVAFVTVIMEQKNRQSKSDEAGDDKCHIKCGGCTGCSICSGTQSDRETEETDR